MPEVEEERLNFFKFGYFGINNPILFSESVRKFNSLKRALLFAGTFLGLGLLLQIVINSIQTLGWQLFFPAVSEGLILLAGFLGILVVYGVLIFILSKALGGKAGLRKTVIAVCYSCFPLFLVFLPYVGLLGFGLFILFVILTVYKINGFLETPKVKTIVIVSIPILGMVLLLFALGLIKPGF